MTKRDLVGLFGSLRKTADALEMTPSGLKKWPDIGDLPTIQADRAAGAVLRTRGLEIARAYFPEVYK